MKNKTLIVDYIPFNVSIKTINESLKKNSGRLIVSGKLQTAGEKNQNNRIYARPILERELQKYSQLIKERRALGELDHPDSSVVNLQNTSHLILDAKWVGNDIIGTIEILPTPAGNILKALFEAQVLLGISSRGLGSVNEIDDEGTVEVGDDFDLIAWDFVSNPSTHGAFMKPVKLQEGVKREIDPKMVCRSKVECLIMDILIDLNS